MRVFVYYNLHKNLWSIKALEGDKKNLVIRHQRALTLEGVTFKVSEAGRQRVLREKRKNVHAGAVGNWVAHDPSITGRRVTYNPYRGSTFVDRETGEPVTHGAKVRFSGNEVYAS